MMTSNKDYKITKELFDEINDNNIEDIKSKGKILSESSSGKSEGDLSHIYVDNYKEEFDKIAALKNQYSTRLEIMLKYKKMVDFTFSKEQKIYSEIINERTNASIDYYASIISFEGKQFYVFTYKVQTETVSYPIYKEEYDDLINNQQNLENINILKEKYKKRFIYDNEYNYAEVK